MFCATCGKENTETAVFCESCGTRLAPAAPAAEATVVPEAPAVPETPAVSEAPVVTPPQPQYTPPQPQYVPPQPQYVPPQPRPVQAAPYNNYAPVATLAAPEIPPEYKPLSGWAYFGWQILFSIPLVGFILLIVFACGGTHNINLRNFARSYFCALLIAAILAVLGIILTLIFGASALMFLEELVHTYG